MTAKQIAPRSKKVGRGKSAATIALGRAAHDVLAASNYPMTLRQLYYALVSAGSIPKTDAAYHKLGRVVRDAREEGSIAWDWLVDHVRSVFRARTWDGIEDLLTDTATLYRRDLMRQQSVAIQLWAESDSIGSVIAPLADQYCVPTFIGRGYAARGYLWSAAKDAITAYESGKTVHILHVGDHDPSGEDIFRDVESTLRLYSMAIDERQTVTGLRRYMQQACMGDADLYDWELRAQSRWLSVDRLALTPDQVEAFHLPIRPPKASDVRTAKFTGKGAVEVEALPVEALLGIVERAIVDLIDVHALAIAEQAEESERAIAMRIASTPVERLVQAGSA